MKINYSIKQLGKKHPVIGVQSIEIDEIGDSPTLSGLIAAIIKQQVEAYNAKETEKNLVNFLLPNQIEEQSLTGKIGFSAIYNENKADLGKAIEAAKQAFEDGIYCVFIDERQIEKLNDVVKILPESIFSFVRLTFLAGSYW